MVENEKVAKLQNMAISPRTDKTLVNEETTNRLDDFRLTFRAWTGNCSGNMYSNGTAVVAGLITAYKNTQSMQEELGHQRIV